MIEVKPEIKVEKTTATIHGDSYVEGKGEEVIQEVLELANAFGHLEGEIISDCFKEMLTDLDGVDFMVTLVEGISLSFMKGVRAGFKKEGKVEEEETEKEEK